MGHSATNKVSVPHPFPVTWGVSQKRGGKILRGRGQGGAQRRLSSGCGRTTGLMAAVVPCGNAEQDQAAQSSMVWKVLMGPVPEGLRTADGC